MQIQDAGLKITSGQRDTLVLSPIALPSGRTLADFTSFALTIRSDPKWPRTGADIINAASADPAGEGWPVVSTADGSVVDATVEFVVSESPTLPAGEHICVVDAWGLGDTTGPVQLLRATWLTVLPSVRAL